MANPMPQVGTLSRGKVRESITAVRAICSLLKVIFPMLASLNSYTDVVRITSTLIVEL